MPDAERPQQQSGTNEVGMRLDELEMRSEFQARGMEDLDAVVREFAERVARLERELKTLRAQLEALTGEAGAFVDDEDIE